MRGFEELVESSNLVDQRNLLAEGVLGRSDGLREAGAAERIRVIQELDPAHQSGHRGSEPLDDLQEENPSIAPESSRVNQST